jgi:SAM-dependent methyltransferase
VLAVEPSAVMRAQRPPDAAPVIGARAESLPFDDNAVDAAMACLTIHHWDPPAAGLAELRRVARGPVVVFTFDLDCLPAWQHDHLREGLALERPRFPTIDDIATALGGRTRVEQIATPGDCVDGFFEAFWRRPEALLDPAVRSAQSMWALLPAGVEQRIVARLSAALESGAWDAEHGHLREQEEFPGALRLVVSQAR